MQSWLKNNISLISKPNLFFFTAINLPVPLYYLLNATPYVPSTFMKLIMLDPVSWFDILFCVITLKNKFQLPEKTCETAND